MPTSIGGILPAARGKRPQPILNNTVNPCRRKRPSDRKRWWGIPRWAALAADPSATRTSWTFRIPLPVKRAQGRLSTARRQRHNTTARRQDTTNRRQAMTARLRVMMAEEGQSPSRPHARNRRSSRIRKRLQEGTCPNKRLLKRNPPRSRPCHLTWKHLRKAVADGTTIWICSLCRTRAFSAEVEIAPKRRAGKRWLRPTVPRFSRTSLRLRNLPLGKLRLRNLCVWRSSLRKAPRRG